MLYICLSVAGLFHLAYCLPGSSTWSHMTEFQRLNNDSIVLHTYTHFLYPFIPGWTLRLFPCVGYHEQRCTEHAPNRFLLSVYPMPGAVKWTRICFRGGLRGRHFDSERKINIPDCALFYDENNIGSGNRECLGLPLISDVALRKALSEVVCSSSCRGNGSAKTLWWDGH